MNRREFIQRSIILGGSIAFSPQLLWGTGNMKEKQKVLLLLELKGGNDSLNTFIPYKDQHYYSNRPNIAIPKAKVLPITNTVALHPSMDEFQYFWRKGELAILPGLGYADPNRSHFRSIDIWNTASASDEYLSEGWIAPLLQKKYAHSKKLVHGIVIGNGNEGPLYGEGMNNVMIQNIHKFLREGKRQQDDVVVQYKKEVTRYQKKNPALSHILQTQLNLLQASQELRKQLQNTNKLQMKFPRSRFARHMKLAAKIIASGMHLPVIKIALGGFDTHNRQLDPHARRLKELSQGLQAFRNAMVQLGKWDDVLVVSYSEFGRRVAENSSMGTDHGTAATHFMLGGAVKRGVYGEMPSLRQLQNGDLVYTQEYKSLYRTIAEKWWGVEVGNLLQGNNIVTIPCI
ncbi:MAG: DUF1501 domain-containing protein [Spirochaetota bacterium]